jgi:subtilisin-like proprotein convertase family protein
MKRAILTTVICAWGMLAQAQYVTNNYTLLPATTIPDGNPVGVTETFNVSGLTAPSTDVQFSLNVSGGFNGDLYSYLVAPNGSIAILLNRVGISGSNPVGYSDSGFDVTFDDSGLNIHNYQSDSPTLVGGQLTQTWAPDGRNINPLSAGSAFDSASTTSDLSDLIASDPNGTWTFFIADMSSGGGTETVNSLTLSIISVPEPSALALAGVGLAGGAMLLRWRRKA